MTIQQVIDKIIAYHPPLGELCSNREMSIPDRDYMKTAFSP